MNPAHRRADAAVVGPYSSCAPGPRPRRLRHRLDRVRRDGPAAEHRARPAAAALRRRRRPPPTRRPAGSSRPTRSASSSARRPSRRSPRAGRARSCCSGCWSPSPSAPSRRRSPRPSSSCCSPASSAALPHGAYFGIASLVAASLMGPGKRGKGVAFVLSGLTIANVDRRARRSPGSARTHGWRVAYLVVAAIFALTFVAVAFLVPWQAGDPKATMRQRAARVHAACRCGSRSLIGAIGFGGFFAVYTYIAPLVTEVTGLARVGRAARARRGRPRHDRRQPRRRLGAPTAASSAACCCSSAILLVGLAVLCLHRGHRRRACWSRCSSIAGACSALSPDHPDPADGCGARQPVDRRRPQPLGAQHRQRVGRLPRRADDRRRLRLPVADRGRRRCWPSRASCSR